eukprot:sb/3466358/
MKELELCLSLVVPSLILVLPITLPFQSLGEILITWLCTVSLISAYSLTFLSLCVPQVTKSTTRLARFQSFFTKEIAFLLSANLIFSYFMSGLVNIWYTDDLQSNLSLFWCTVTAQYHLSDCILHYKYQYTSPAVRIPWVTKLRLNGPQWAKHAATSSLKVIRFVLPVYVLFYSDITHAASYISKTQTENLGYQFFLRPSTLINIPLNAFFTLLSLTLCYQATIHVAANSDIPKVKGRTSLERCIEAIKSTDLRLKYHGLTDITRSISSSLNSRVELLNLYDGHPVMWHTLYKELTGTLTTFNTAMADTPTKPTSPVTNKSPTKQAGRALKVDTKPTQLYSPAP